MKYIKRYNEDIDWDWVDEEIRPIKDIEKYCITYYSLDECINIADKLKELGYSVYGYGDWEDYSFWIGFIYQDGRWVQTKRNKYNREIITYNDL